MCPNQHDSFTAEYQAAIALERAAWTVARDESVQPQERVVAYARWRRAAERVKVLADHVLSAGNDAHPPPSQRDP